MIDECASCFASFKGAMLFVATASRRPPLSLDLQSVDLYAHLFYKLQMTYTVWWQSDQAVIPIFLFWLTAA